MYNGCIEDIILSSLIHNESYTRRVLPFLKMEYFTQPHHRELFKLIALYIEKYNGCPSVAAVAIDLSNSSNVNQEQVEQIGGWLDECKPDNVIAEDYLIDQTEHFCQDKAIYNAIMNSIKIIDGSDKKLDKGSIPALLNEALGVSFDSNVGHDFLENAEDRYEFYHRIEDRISFDLDLLNIITKGGLPKKTLNVILAGCVHPDTLVRVRFKPRNSTLAGTNIWNEKQIPIKEIKDLLEQGYEVEVDSPDGFVPVSLFVDKGEWDEYRLDLCDGRSVLVNENHLFETPDGWTYAKDMHRGKFPSYLVLTDTGWVEGKVTKTDNKIPIVDIQVEHENHRYYTNGVSSHNTNVGKSLAMCHMAAYNLMKGCNVLYITCEMAEERIAERIDANLTNTTMDELAALSREDYLKKVNRVQQKAKGKLIIKEYPTASAHTGHFRHLIHELKLKRNFKPDIIYVDYINICASARLKMGGSVNSYGYIKAIAEELRGLAQELDLPIVTATQTTRSGFSNSDLSLEDTSECIAVDQHITLVGGETKEIGNVKLGDQITSASADFNTTMVVHHKKIKPCVKITTASGKTIIVSRDHVFPMKNEDGTTARLSVNTGLKVGDVLKSVN